MEAEESVVKVPRDVFDMVVSTLSNLQNGAESAQVRDAAGTAAELPKSADSPDAPLRRHTTRQALLKLASRKTGRSVEVVKIGTVRPDKDDSIVSYYPLPWYGVALVQRRTDNASR